MIAPATCSRANSTPKWLVDVTKRPNHVPARKTPRNLAFLVLVHLLAGAPPKAHSQTVDSTALFTRARQAEIEYESSIRRFAPLVFSSRRGQRCDEVIGSYCIFLGASPPLPAEPPQIRIALEKAIMALENAFELAPERQTVAFPLVRLLVAADRPAEAVTRALAHANAATAHDEAAMLAVYAFHHARRIPEAELWGAAWLDRLPPGARDRIESVHWLLDAPARRRYRDLPPLQRKAYETRLWTYADPLYLTPGNELRTDHLARHALSRLLAARPSAAAIESWDPDLEEILIRWGPAHLTTRSTVSGVIGGSESFTEHWDPSQRTYAPPALETALGLTARLDTVWPLDTLNARGGHSPPTIRMMRALQLQAPVFGRSADMLVVAGAVQVDSSARTGSFTTGVFVLDSALNIVAESTRPVAVTDDSVVLHHRLRIPNTAAFYSAEVYDSVSRFGARARYRIEKLSTPGRVWVTGLLLTAPFPTGVLPSGIEDPEVRALSRPVITSGMPLGIYAELVAIPEEVTAVNVQIEARSLDRPSAVARAVGWLGRQVGIGGPTPSARLAWDVEIQSERPTPLAVTLDLGEPPPGRYEIAMTVRAAGDTAGVVATQKLLVLKRVREPGRSRP